MPLETSEIVRESQGAGDDHRHEGRLFVGRTGRLSIALLMAAILSAPIWAQSDYDLDNVPAGPEINEEWDGGVGLETDLNALEAAHAELIAMSDLQLERPEADPIEFEPSEPPGWLSSLVKLLGHLGPLLKFIFYACIVLVLAGVLYFLFGEAMRIRFGGKKDKSEGDEDDIVPDFRPDQATARSLLEEADALAREGRFAEAVHLLLFRSIEDIQSRVEMGVPRSMTAREIGRLGYLPDRARSALGPIIAIVERSFFGGRDVDETGWQSARASYEDFAFGGEWA